MLKLLQIVWASPNTLLGVTIGLIGFLFGGKWQLIDGCVEFYGGLVARLLKWDLLGGNVIAMTLGHSILGQTKSGLDIARDHEHVHVRQYERWGPFFLVAYLGCSCFLWLQNRDAYRENPFEVAAYRIADINPKTHANSPSPDVSADVTESDG